jgi:DNA-binding IclR family transcriptional regulator
MIKSVEKIIAILNILNETPNLGVTKIAEMIEVNKSSAYRLLSTLEMHDFVQRNPETKKYKLGLVFLKYYSNIISDLSLTHVARPSLEKLVADTGESAHLCVLSKNNTAIFIDNISGPGKINVNVRVGSEEEFYCSAVGKNLVAFMPTEKLNKLVDSVEFKQHTIRTVTSKNVLLEQLERIRQQGYAMDDEEIFTGVRCVAAPIRDYKGNVVASLGISGSAARIEINNIGEYAQAVIAAAREISEKLGYSPTHI